MKRFLTIALLVGILGAIPATASASTPSVGCNTLNDPSADGEYVMGALETNFHGGEVLTMGASASPSSTATPTELGLYVMDEAFVRTLLTSVAFPGTLSWTVPADGTYSLRWESNDFVNVVWSVACGDTAPSDIPPPGDSDGDGIGDAEDRCDGTSMGDDPADLMRNRFYTDADGAFVDAKDTDSGYTLADTYGCDHNEIIEALGLGRGHQRFGITWGILRAWAN